MTLIIVPREGQPSPLKAGEKNPQGQVAEGSRIALGSKQKKGQGLYFLVMEMQAHWFQPSQEQYFPSTVKGTDLCILVTQKLAVDLSWSVESDCTVVCNHDFLDTDITTAVIAFQCHLYAEGAMHHFV